MMKILKAIDRVYSIFLKAVMAMLAAVMLVLALATTWQVLSRYIAGAPQTWPTDIAAYGLVFLTFIGMGILLRDDGHICVDILYMRLPGTAQHILDVVMDIVGTGTVLVMAWFSFKLDVDYAVKKTFLIGSVFYMPKVYIFSFIPAGLTLTGIEYIRRLVRHTIVLVKGGEAGSEG